MAKGKNLGDFEQLVILAVMRLGEGAYGMAVRREIEANAGRSVSLGAIYATLDRLEEKGLVSSAQGNPTPQRRGRAKRFFRAEALGVRALQESLAALDRLRRGIKELDDPIGAET
ncbi:MAG: PadR family transcriptional regulator [Gemmatimonadota bacterium]|jgi:DNA-binding PadR family transcriptional regulator